MAVYSGPLQNRIPKWDYRHTHIQYARNHYPKIIPPQPEKNTLLPSTKKDKKADKLDESTQALFDYVAEDTRAPVASTSGISEASRTSNISEPPEPAIDKPKTNKPPKYIEQTSKVLRASKPSSNEISSARAQREERLRKLATDHGKDPDKFITITEKDVNLSQEYRDRMMADAEVIEFARENKMDPNDLFYMTRRERLISEKIYLWEFENVGKSQKYIYDDEEWQKNISILQENDKLKRDKGCQRFQKGYNFSREQAFILVPDQRICRSRSRVTPKEGEDEAGEVNICQVSDIIPDRETIESISQRIV
ncbi:hypothetical protein RhiirC2_800456 [Rhizophagus irregularis]|uniref:Uncharacterized protein n=1 Tax=Rhizophagus irregularis TaxID=588596 RepID=A0A2N1M3N2_9GLOM|nr:hypothetical protein RhiirC2_800456 [Rhizophagus irregularis]